MNIFNGDVEFLAQVLFELELKGKQSRMRTRMVNKLDEYLKNTLMLEQQDIINSYAEKDENDEMIYLDIEKKQPLMKEGFQKELNELFSESFVIENNEENKTMLETIADIFTSEDFPIAFKGYQALIFDRWCEEFEKVLEHYSKEEKSKEKKGEAYDTPKYL